MLQGVSCLHGQLLPVTVYTQRLMSQSSWFISTWKKYKQCYGVKNKSHWRSRKHCIISWVTLHCAPPSCAQMAKQLAISINAEEEPQLNCGYYWCAGQGTICCQHATHDHMTNPFLTPVQEPTIDKFLLGHGKWQLNNFTHALVNPLIPPTDLLPDPCRTN